MIQLRINCNKVTLSICIVIFDRHIISTRKWLSKKSRFQRTPFQSLRFHFERSPKCISGDAKQNESKRRGTTRNKHGIISNAGQIKWTCSGPDGAIKVARDFIDVLFSSPRLYEDTYLAAMYLEIVLRRTKLARRGHDRSFFTSHKTWLRFAAPTRNIDPSTKSAELNSTRHPPCIQHL